MVRLRAFVIYHGKMSTLEAENVARIFESRPVDTATWLVGLDAIAAIHRVVKDEGLIEIPDEFAANKVIKSLGNGDYDSVLRYFTRPEIYPPGMASYAQKIGARTLRGGFDPSLMAVLTYKTNKSIRSTLDHHIPAFELYAGARDFQSHFVRVASDKVSIESHISRVDLTLAIKNDTAFWIDK